MRTPSPLCIVMLAAGRSRRMGGEPPIDKLMQPLGAHPLLAGRVDAAMATGLDLVVVLPPKTAYPERWKLVQSKSAFAVPCPQADTGMGDSLSVGFSILPGHCRAALVLLADMPELTTEDILAVAHHATLDVVVRGASAEGHPGHPVRIPRRLFPEMKSLTGDRGAQAVLASEQVSLVALPHQHALTDLDTPEDWQRFS